MPEIASAVRVYVVLVVFEGVDVYTKAELVCAKADVVAKAMPFGVKGMT